MPGQTGPKVGHTRCVIVSPFRAITVIMLVMQPTCRLCDENVHDDN